jgi:hypothetical protein
MTTEFFPGFVVVSCMCERVAPELNTFHVLRFSRVTVIPSMLSISAVSAYCCYWKDKWTKLGNLPKSNNISEIWEN